MIQDFLWAACKEVVGECLQAVERRLQSRAAGYEDDMLDGSQDAGGNSISYADGKR